VNTFVYIQFHHLLIQHDSNGASLSIPMYTKSPVQGICLHQVYAAPCDCAYAPSLTVAYAILLYALRLTDSAYS
jgi:hypothetical protein